MGITPASNKGRDYVPQMASGPTKTLAVDKSAFNLNGLEGRVVAHAHGAEKKEHKGPSKHLGKRLGGRRRLGVGLRFRG